MENTENSNLIADKTRVPGKAKEWALDVTESGKDRIRVMFALGGDYVGRHLTWDGYFTDATFDRTVEALRHMGWEGMDLGDIGGLDKNDVELVVGVERYTNPETGEEKTYNRVDWVNRSASLFLKKPMDAAQKASFAQRMKGKLHALQAGQPKPSPAKTAPANAPTSLDDIPF